MSVAAAPVSVKASIIAATISFGGNAAMYSPCFPTKINDEAAAVCRHRSQALSSTFSFCANGEFESRKLEFWYHKWRIFLVWGPFWGVFGRFGVTKSHFYVFSCNVTAPTRVLEFCMPLLIC
jgi:hypothetical protein